LYLGLVFVAGTVFGFAASELHNARTAQANALDRPTNPQEYRRKLLTELDKELNLDDEQESDILLILDKVGERFHEVRDAMEPEFEAIRSERAALIMGVLTPRQRVQYARMLEEGERAQREK